MLKNLNPLLSGALLTALDDMREGQLLTLVNSDYPESALVSPVIDLGEVTTEAAADAILSVLPLAEDRACPIAFLDRGESDLPDVAYAVGGLASDAELRRVDMERLGEAEFAERARDSVLAVRVRSEAPPAAFLFRKGAC